MKMPSTALARRRAQGPTTVREDVLRIGASLPAAAAPVQGRPQRADCPETRSDLPNSTHVAAVPARHRATGPQQTHSTKPRRGRQERLERLDSSASLRRSANEFVGLAVRTPTREMEPRTTLCRSERDSRRRLRLFQTAQWTSQFDCRLKTDKSIRLPSQDCGAVIDANSGGIVGKVKKILPTPEHPTRLRIPISP